MEKNLQVEKSKSQKGAGLIRSLFENKLIRYYTVGAVIVITAFLLQYFINKPNLGTFLASDMDPMGNVYILGVDEDSSQYKITKIGSNGAQNFKIDLDKSTNESEYSYSNLESDNKGNIYVVKRTKTLTAVVPDKSHYPIKNETVLMYDTYGNFVKDVTSVDFSSDTTAPTEPYIKKIQLIGQNMSIIAGKNDVYDIITVNPLQDESPKKAKTFVVSPPNGYTAPSSGWLLDACVLSSGRVFYSTPNGELWAMNNTGAFVNYSNTVSTSGFLISGMYVDTSDNIYFTDSVSGAFYQLNTQSIVSKQIYNLDSVVLEKQNIKISDLRKLKVISDGNFYAPSKAFDKPYYVGFGVNSVLISDIRGKFFPFGLLIMLAFVIIFFIVIYDLKYLSSLEFTRIPLRVRIISMLLPVLVLGMGCLVYINTRDSVISYTSILKSEQQRGAKTVADKIDGTEFTKINHVRDYMTKDYMSIKESVENGYRDLSLKIGDRSDYIVTYIEKYNKLYATISTKYDVSSDSYNRLKYTDPDMVPSQYILIDSILENDEVEKLYGIWEKFSNKSSSSDCIEADFRDVYGNISAAFVPIKDSSGVVVGFVGNFLDEEIHSTNEFYSILKHSLAVILVFAVVMIGYIAFVIRWCLRPLKKIEKGIVEISHGNWDSRIKISSKDEFADIAQAFNIMSDKIDRYTNNLVKLNREYVRYVPSKIFNLMGKEKVTQVKLHDNKVVEMNIIYVTFNLSCKGSYEFKDENEIFDALNKSYDEMFKIVESNDGVVQSFDGLGAVFLFPKNAQNAFNAAIQLKEIAIPDAVKAHMNVTLGHGSVLVGVSGNTDRRGILVVSDEIMQMFKIDSYLEKLGINQVATKDIIDKIKEVPSYTYRYIGKVRSVTGEGGRDIYEMIDGSNKYKSDLYKITDENFEQGLKLYLTGDFEEARKVFTEVIRVNEGDKISIHYLAKCDKNIQRRKNSGGSIEGFTGYII